MRLTCTAVAILIGIAAQSCRRQPMPQASHDRQAVAHPTDAGRGLKVDQKAFPGPDGGVMMRRRRPHGEARLKFDWNDCAHRRLWGLRGPTDNPPPWPLWREGCGPLTMAVSFDPQASSARSLDVMRDLAHTRRDEKLLECLSGIELAETEYDRGWDILLAVSPDGRVSLVSLAARRMVLRPDGVGSEADVIDPARKQCVGRALRGLRVEPPKVRSKIMWTIGVARTAWADGIWRSD